MALEDREEYVDMVAQAVIDKIEERDRLAVLVEQVAHRVMQLQQAQAEAAPNSDQTNSDEAQDPAEETQNAGEPVGE